MSEWQPIETAPKDETPVLLYVPVNRRDRRILTCSYCEIEWAICGGAVLLGKPTHWMHLPDAPSPLSSNCDDDLDAMTMDEIADAVESSTVTSNTRGTDQ